MRKKDPNKARMVSWRMPPWIIAKLREHPGSQAQTIITALLSHYGWQKPPSDPPAQ